MFLLSRPEDHVLVGVRWTDLGVFRRDAGVFVLAPDGREGRLHFLLPPQHTAEEVRALDDPAAGTPWQAVLSGASLLEFVVPVDADDIVLTASGVLAAARNFRLGSATTLEVPWGVLLSPRPLGADEVLVSRHPVEARLSDVNALWRSAVVPMPRDLVGELASELSVVLQPDRPLGLVAVDRSVDETEDPFPLPLTRSDRGDITRSATPQRPAIAERLQLTALGASLRAAGHWPSFDWQHDAVLGRDQRVRTVVEGFLYPFGHRAVYDRLTVRTTEASGDNTAELRTAVRLTIVEPRQARPDDSASRRPFPFDDVEVTRLEYTDLFVDQPWQQFAVPGVGATNMFFRPTRRDGSPVLFPVSLFTPDGQLRLELPLLFVKDLSPKFDSLGDVRLGEALARWYGDNAVAIPPTRIDLVRADSTPSGATDRDPAPTSPAAFDVHEVHGFTITGAMLGGRLRPMLSKIDVALPAVQTLVGQDALRSFTFAEQYLAEGADAAAFLVKHPQSEPIDVNFVGQSDAAGGLAAPHIVNNAISRALGPVKVAPDNAAELIRDPLSLIEPDATLLGFPLRDLIAEIAKPPAITSLFNPGQPPAVHLEWTGIVLRDRNGFVNTGGAELSITADVKATGTFTRGTVRNFALRFPTNDPVIELSFKMLEFTRRTGLNPTAGNGPRSTSLRIDGLSAKLLGKLKLLEDLKKAVSVLGAPPEVDVSPQGVSVRYAVPLPAASAGVFVMRNIIFRTGVDVPFDGRPVDVTIGFASRESPFVLTVMAFGGGGYVELAANHLGLRRLEAALEFGALVAVNFGIASGEAHILGGVRLSFDRDNGVSITGYIRIGGSLDILGIVSVSVELRLELSYRSDTNVLVGRAKLVIEIEVLFLSESVELDSGEWKLAGGSVPTRGRSNVAFAATEEDEPFPAFGRRASFDEWQRYRRSFAPADVQGGR